MENYFVKKINSILNDCYLKNRTHITSFLTTSEQEIVLIEAKKFPSLNVKFDGGFINSEYQKAIISPFLEEVDNEISVLKINFNPKFLTLTHRLILGILLHLGINRDRIGDILVLDCCAYVAVSSNLCDFIINNLTEIRHQPITITKTNEVIEAQDKGIEKTIFVESPRLDAIICGAFNISRLDGKEIIGKELVKVNQKIVTKSFQNINACDIISVAHKGRIKILDTTNTTRSGRIVIKIKIYR